MISLPVFLSFVTICAIIEATPGPNMAYLAILSISNGRRAGFAAVAGVALGLLIVGLAASMGVAAIIANSPPLYETLRWGGVIYMLWLAWAGWQESLETSPGQTVAAEHRTEFFRRGLITNLLNPKAALFYIAILPEFIRSDENIAAQAALLTLSYVTIATAIHTFIVVLGSTLRPYLEEPKRNRLIRRVLSALLALVALWLAWSTKLQG